MISFFESLPVIRSGEEIGSVHRHDRFSWSYRLGRSGRNVGSYSGQGPAETALELAYQKAQKASGTPGGESQP